MKSLPIHSQAISSRKLRDAAATIAEDQGLAVLTIDPIETIKLGTATVYVRTVLLVDMQSETSFPRFREAPSEIIGPVRADTMTAGTLEELRHRLAVVFGLDALIGDDDPDAVPAAICFANDAYGAFRAIDPLVAEIDFLTWRGLGRDLSAWFEVRFVKSRILAA